MASNWPPAAITAIDPLPYHGLVYTVPGNPQIMLDPMDGRAPVVMPEFYSMNLDGSRLADYTARQDGFLWDVGMPDPPPDAEIEAAGGKLLGKRIVGSGLELPVRFGDTTRHVFTSMSVSDDVVKINAQERNAVGYELASFPLADVELPWDQVTNEEGGRPASAGRTPSYGGELLDRSPDGRRQLFGVSLLGLAGAGGWASALVAVVQVVLRLDEEGVIRGDAEVLHTYEELLGSYTFTVESELNRLDSDSSGYPSCTLTPVVRNFPEETSGNVGYRRWTGERTGFVVGALYGSSGVDFITASYTSFHEETIDTSTEPYQSGKPNTESGTCEPWPSGEAPPLPPTLQTYTQHDRYELGLQLRGQSITAWLKDEGETSLVQPGGGSPTGTSIRVQTASAGLSRELEGPVSPGRLISLDKVSPRPDAEWLYLPTALYAQLNFTLSAVVARNWVSLATFEQYGSETNPDPDAYWGPLLSPSGLHGDTQQHPIQKTGTLIPTFIYRAAYNPITGQGVRECDMPGRTIAGFI